VSRYYYTMQVLATYPDAPLAKSPARTDRTLPPELESVKDTRLGPERGLLQGYLAALESVWALG
jgi:hypothetical protein